MAGRLATTSTGERRRRTVRYEAADGVATITLDRPEQLNRWTPLMAVDLTAALDRAETDDDVGAIVLTGAGRAFCAGLDLAEAPSFDAAEPTRADDAPVAPLQTRHRRRQRTCHRCRRHAGVDRRRAIHRGRGEGPVPVRPPRPRQRAGIARPAASDRRPRGGRRPAAVGPHDPRRRSPGAAARLAFLPAAEVVDAATAWARDVAASTNRAAVASSKRLLLRDVEHLLAEIAPLEVAALGALARTPEALAALERLRPPS